MIKAVFLIISISLLSLFSLSAQTLTDLQKRKDQIESDIKKSSELLDKYGKQKTKAMTNVRLLNVDLNKRLQLIGLYEKEINWLNEDIGLLKQEISNSESKLKELKDNYAKLIQKSYYNRKIYNEFTFFLGANSFNEAYRRFIILRDYNRYRRTQGSLIEKEKADLEEKHKLLEVKLKVQTNALEGVVKEKDLIQLQTKRLNSSIYQLKKKEKQVKNDIQNNQKALQQLEKEILKVIEAASKETYTISDFDKAQGKLNWPVQSGVIISQFGEHQHPVLKYVKVNNNGVDIQCQNDPQCYSVFEGKVSRVITIPGYNKTVIIRHGKYLTVYANLETVQVKKGQNIEKGNVLGKIYSGEGENSNVLHFEIWEENKKLNPEYWLSH